MNILEETLAKVIAKLERTCKRCGHSWTLRQGVEPKVCPNPKCKSHYWNKERRILKKDRKNVV